MKSTNIAKVLGLVLTAAVLAPASAGTSTGSLGLDVQSAVGQGTVHVALKDGVATLRGFVETRYDANKARKAALEFEGVDRVVNHLVISN